jgi:hypothetical protein
VCHVQPDDIGRDDSRTGESLSFGFAELRTRFAALAAEFGAPDGWRVRDARKPRRVVVLVSKEDDPAEHRPDRQQRDDGDH